MKKGPTSKRYSEAFKRQIVRDIERGVVSPGEVQRRYGVSGAVTIRGWLRRYGRGQVSRRVKRRDVIESRKLLVLEREKRELERAVARLTVEKVAYESLIEEAQAQLGIELKKTFGQGR